MAIIRKQEINKHIAKFEQIILDKCDNIKGYDYYNSFNAFNYLWWLSKCGGSGSWEVEEMRYTEMLINRRSIR